MHNYHIMKLQKTYFNYIINGTKRIEIRLNDKKRQKVKVDDIIEFVKEPDCTESFKVKVNKLHHYNSFYDMFKDFDISILADKSMTKEELINVLEEFYTKQKQNKYGVLGIGFELL